MNVKGTCTIVNHSSVKENMGCYELEIDYNYYYKNPTHEDPFEDQLDIKEVRLNSLNITQFYWDYLNEDMFEKIYEYAVENKHENHE